MQEICLQFGSNSKKTTTTVTKEKTGEKRKRKDHTKEGTKDMFCRLWSGEGT